MKLKVNIYNGFLFILLAYLLLLCFVPELNKIFVHGKSLVSILFIIFTISLISNINKSSLIPIVFLGGYILYSLITILGLEVNIKDYITVFLAFFYLLMLSFFVGKQKIALSDFNKFLFVLLIIYCAKYLFLKLIFAYPRPILFIENNFELLLLGILVIGYINYNKKINFWYLILFAIISFLSGSRSGMGIFVFIMITGFFKKEYLKPKYLWIYLLLFLGVLIGYMKFLERIPEGGIMEIDRLKFLTYFLAEIRLWGIKEYLFGVPIITEMSSFTCEGLAYYRELYSYSGKDICYSVILHSFILRVLFDHGIVGLFSIFGILAYMLKKSGLKLRYIIAITGVLILNSLSISSVNSIFAIFALGVIMLVNEPKETLSKSKT